MIFSQFAPAQCRFKIKGTFFLLPTSNGIDPLTEDVTIQVGTVSTTIPAGAFGLNHSGKFRFEGSIDGIALAVKITPLGDDVFRVQAEAANADLTATMNPVTVVVTIGDNTWQDRVIAQFDAA